MRGRNQYIRKTPIKRPTAKDAWAPASSFEPTEEEVSERVSVA